MSDCITDYGFTWGPIEVQRGFHDKSRRGGYMPLIATPTKECQVWVSKSGRSVMSIVTKRRRRK